MRCRSGDTKGELAIRVIKVIYGLDNNRGVFIARNTRAIAKRPTGRNAPPTIHKGPFARNRYLPFVIGRSRIYIKIILGSSVGAGEIIKDRRCSAESGCTFEFHEYGDPPGRRRARTEIPAPRSSLIRDNV